MVDYEKYLVPGCPLCDLFSKKREINTKLYYPKYSQINEDTEFIILDSFIYGTKGPIIVVGDHVENVGRETWGRILYRCRKMFGSGIELKFKQRRIPDHWYAQINSITNKLDRLYDLRDR